MWQVLAERGHATASIAYPHARPGKCWSGVHIDDRLLKMSGLTWDDWPLPQEVSPRSIREHLRLARVHVTDVSAALLAPFESSGPLDDGKRRAVAAEMARASTLFGAVDVIASTASPELLAVHINWPARFAAALDVAVRDLPPPVWSLLDQAITKLLTLAGPGSTFVLVSPGTAGGPGFTMAAGAQARAFGPSVLDVAPTLLSCFGEIMPAVSASPTDQVAPDVADEARVESFGHTLPSPPSGWPAPRLIAEAELLLDTDLAAAGVKARDALAAAPQSVRALALAGLIAFARGDADALGPYADRLSQLAPDHLWAAMLRAGCHVLERRPREAAPLLRRIEAEGSIDDRLRVAGAWLMLGRGSEAERVFEAILADQPDCVVALVGLAERKMLRPFDAEQLLRRALAIDPMHEAARKSLAELLNQAGRSNEATHIRSAPNSR